MSATLAGLTAVLAWEANRSRKAAAFPNVVVTVEPWKGPTHLSLVIENVGPGVAYNLSVRPNQDIESDELKGKLEEKDFLDQPMLKPFEKVKFLLGSISSIKPKQASFRVVCKDVWGGEHTLSSSIDIDAILGTEAQFAEYQQKSLSALQDIEKDLGKVVQSAKTLEEWIKETRRREKKEREKPRSVKWKS